MWRIVCGDRARSFSRPIYQASLFLPSPVFSLASITLAAVSLGVWPGDRMRAPGPVLQTRQASLVVRWTHLRTRFREVCHLRAVSAMLPVSTYLSINFVLAACAFMAYASL